MSPPSTLTLHRYHLGELPAEEHRAVQAAIEADPETRRRYQALLAAESDFDVQPVPQAILDLAAPEVPWWRRWLPVWGPGLGLAAAAAAVLVVAGPGLLADPALDDATPTEAPYVGTKGALPDLEVWIAGEAGPRPLAQGEAVGEGDAVQLAFDPHGARFVTLAGRDGTGQLEVYGTLETGGAEGLTTAPFSLVLDDAPGPQEFLVLAHDAPLSDVEIRVQLQDGTGDLKTITLDKH